MSLSYMAYQDDDTDDSFIAKVLDKQMSESPNSIYRDKTVTKIMSYSPKDMVKDQAIITQEEAAALTEWKEIQKRQAEFKKKHGMQGYAWEEIKVSDKGNSLIIDMDKVQNRKETSKVLLDKAVDIEKHSAKGVKHFLEDGKTVLLKKEVDDSNGNTNNSN